MFSSYIYEFICYNYTNNNKNINNKCIQSYRKMLFINVIFIQIYKFINVIFMQIYKFMIFINVIFIQIYKFIIFITT